MATRLARTAEIAMIADSCGFDAFFIDMEHCTISLDDEYLFTITQRRAMRLGLFKELAEVSCVTAPILRDRRGCWKNGRERNCRGPWLLGIPLFQVSDEFLF